MTAKNLLADETSPYLLQHAANPVHWHPWGNAALAEANERGKPILLSVGYAACHWCHVMAHESFEDPDTAALMNELFVCIKVDREERPDVDQLYMTALHALGEQGGWPLTMFLDSAGAPFWGGTYFPPEPRYGRASFRQVLQGIATAFASDADAIRRNALALTRSLARQAEPTPGALPDDTDLAQLASAFLRLTDAEYGGLRGAPKFPNPPVFRLLWQFGRRLGKPAMCEAVHLLLTRMTHGGIYDQLGGGYARYSTDSVWLVPHFEKMLYDNAQILELLACAYASDRRPLYQAAADQTVRWLLRDMIAEPRDGDAAFAASEDADSEGEEGRFYVWEEAQIDDLLGLSAAAFKQAYDVTAGGNWDGQCILRWVSAQGDPASFEGDRSILFAARAQRVRPGRDDKVLADWNGLTIAALARAAGVFDRSDWLLAAISAYRFVCTHMRQASGGIAHSWRLGRVTAHGVLDDQAAMARAALALFEATGERQFLADAESLVSASILNFGAPDGAFYLTAADASDLPLGPACRQRTAADNATPAGSGVMAEVFARLFHLTGQDRYRVDCERLIAAFAGGSNGLQAAPSMASAADLLAHGGCIVVSGDPDTPATKTLLRVARAGADLTLCVLAAPTGLADTHPAYNAASSARPSAHLCRNQTCSLPVEEPSQLLALMG